MDRNYNNVYYAKVDGKIFMRFSGWLKAKDLLEKKKREFDGRRTPYEATTIDELEIETDARSRDGYLTSDSSEAYILWKFKVPNVAIVTLVEHVSLIKKPPRRMSEIPEKR